MFGQSRNRRTHHNPQSRAANRWQRVANACPAIEPLEKRCLLSGQPTLIDPTATALASTISLTPGAQVYLYGADTGGALPLSPFADGPVQTATNANGVVCAALAVSTQSSDSFSTSALSYSMIGVGVSGYANMQALYSQAFFTGRNVEASVDFTLTQPALVVAMGLAASQQAISFEGSAGVVTDAAVSGSGNSLPVTTGIAHAYLSAGSFTISELGFVNPPTIPKYGNMADLLGVYIFTGGSPLMLLDPSGQGALTVSGHGAVNAQGGPVIVDSNNAAAVNLSGNATVTGPQLYQVGGDSLSGNAKLNAPISTLSSYVNNPLASLPAPSMSSLPVRSSTTLHISQTPSQPLQPGLYIGGINISGKANVTLAPGTYYLYGGGLNVTHQASLTGDGVMLYNDPGGADGGSLNIGGQGSIVLTPPTSGPYAGISIFQARNATQSITFGGSSVARISGTVYAAAAAVVLSGNTSVMIGGSQADVLGVGLIADNLDISASGVLNALT